MSDDLNTLIQVSLAAVSANEGAQLRLPGTSDLITVEDAFGPTLRRADAELTALSAAADGLASAGDAMIAFHNGLAGEKRPDIWHRLLQRFDAALAIYNDARGVAK